MIGSYGVGLSMRVPRMPDAGETLTGGTFEAGPGGKGSNQAIGAARLGADVRFLTAIGADDYGRAARELWADEGVDASRVVEFTDAPTMAGFIMVEPSGENRIAIAPGALDRLSESDVETFRDEIAQADVVLVSMEIPIDAVVAALRIGRELGVTTILNPAPAQPLPDDALKNVDIITPNQTEARVILGTDDATTSDADVAKAIADRVDAAVIMTRGSEGAIVIENGTMQEIAAVRASHVVDTTGAGDAFNAALAVGVAEGHTLADAAAFAARAGAFAVATDGVVPALPRRQDLNLTNGESL
ncbi:ribokinase [Microbacterium faecale]|uniref:Ribokinase n=1 Tax=Microbacterium faecale TaxID=1804630 RepID=A0A916Y529_9MICO|nr:ribokinase [Microbacterium faecale]